MSEVSSYRLACIIARILDNRQAKEIIILNISNVSVLADYFVICSADSSAQIKALTSYVREKTKDTLDRVTCGHENDSRNRWNLLDYGDVIVHIFHREERQFYAIEKFWSHACTIDEKDWMQETEDVKDSL